MGEECDNSAAGEDVEMSSVPTPPPSQPEPASSSGPERRVLRVPRQRVDSGSTPGPVTPSTGLRPVLGILRASHKLVVKCSNM